MTSEADWLSVINEFGDGPVDIDDFVEFLVRNTIGPNITPEQREWLRRHLQDELRSREMSAQLRRSNELPAELEERAGRRRLKCISSITHLLTGRNA
jgi:hypothetical protein